jgi:GT2 family glycosyltransferase
MRVDWRRRSSELALRLADALRGRAYKVPGAVLVSRRPPTALIAPPAKVKDAAAALSTVKLDAFLSSGGPFILPTATDPEVSILLVTHNRAELTFECLQTLCAQPAPSFEVVIVDNASTDATPVLLERLRGARILRNPTNEHFLGAANQASRHARGNHLLFLNNDVQLLPGTLQSALDTIESSSAIGAVGGRIVQLNGALQEAGSIVWSDGSCLGYGRGDDPHDPAYMFVRDVDYCSGAFLLTRREHFEARSGFDTDFSPAYGEDADYCLRLWEDGLRVVYDPDAVLLHYEFASSSSPEAAIDLQMRNRETLRRKHADSLRHRPPSSAANALQARAHEDAAGRVLLVDDRIPRPSFGSGSSRARQLVTSLRELGYFVTFYPLTEPFESWPRIRRTLPREVEVMMGYGAARLGEFLARRKGYYDLLIVSRPHNMAFVNELLAGQPGDFDGLRIVYDAEALFSLRQVTGHRLRGEDLSPARAKALLDEELELARTAHRVIAVSEAEASEFRTHGLPSVHVLGHALPLTPTPRPFGERTGFLFVGSVHDPASPNADSLRWFVREVWPLILARFGRARFDIVGENQCEEVRHLASGGVRVLGPIEDLLPVYDDHRVFVAPTRFAAGIPHKVHEAAAHGLPVVSTPLIARQLGWDDGVELLTAETAADFAAACLRIHGDDGLWDEIRANALRRTDGDCSPARFRESLQQIVGG